MGECLFCKIAQKEIGAEIVYEDAHAIAVLDIHPRALGHTMVIPKTHADSFRSLPAEEIGPTFAAVQSMTKTLEQVFQPHAFTIGINEGKAAGQVVAHLHIHIIPRWENDGGASIHSVVNRPPDAPLSDIAKKIRNAPPLSPHS